MTMNFKISFESGPDELANGQIAVVDEDREFAGWDGAIREAWNRVGLTGWSAATITEARPYGMTVRVLGSDKEALNSAIAARAREEDAKYAAEGTLTPLFDDEV